MGRPLIWTDPVLICQVEINIHFVGLLFSSNNIISIKVIYKAYIHASYNHVIIMIMLGYNGKLDARG